MTPTAQLHAIMPVVTELQEHCDKILAKLFTRLKEYGYEKVDFSKLSKEEERFWKKILPVGTVSGSLSADH